MSGAGFASHASNVLKGNRVLLKRRKYKDIKELVYETAGKTQVEFKHISSEELQRIKQTIREQHRLQVRFELQLYGLCLLLAIGLVYFLVWFFYL